MIRSLTPILLSFSAGLAVGVATAHRLAPHGGWPFSIRMVVLLFTMAAAVTVTLHRRLPSINRPLLIAALACFGVAAGTARHQDSWRLAQARPSARMLLAATGEAWVEAEGVVERPIRPRTGRTADLMLRLGRVRVLADDHTWVSAPGDRLTVRLFDRKPLAESAPVADWPSWSAADCAGDRVRVRGRKPSLPAGAPPAAGEFDVAGYLVREGYSGTLHVPVKNLEVLASLPPTPLQAVLLNSRTALSRAFLRHLTGARVPLARATVLGDRAALEGEAFRGKSLVELMSAGGIAHAMAVSGLHAGIVAGSLMALLAWVRVPRRFWPAAVIPVLAFYVLMTGLTPSSARALLMTSVTLIVLAIGRAGLGRSVLFSLGLAASVMILFKPLSILSAGFQLSYSAVLSLAVLTKPIEAFIRQADWARLGCVGLWAMAAGGAAALAPWICATWAFPPMLFGVLALAVGRHKGNRPKAVAEGREEQSDTTHATVHAQSRTPLARMPKGIGSLLAAQAAVQVGSVFPLSAALFGSYAAAGVFVNLAAVPLVGLFVPAALGAAILGQIPVVGLWLAWPISQAADITGTLFLESGYWGSRLIHPLSMPRPETAVIVWYYVCLILFCISRMETIFRTSKETPPRHA